MSVSTKEKLVVAMYTVAALQVRVTEASKANNDIVILAGLSNLIKNVIKQTTMEKATGRD